MNKIIQEIINKQINYISVLFIENLKLAIENQRKIKEFSYFETANEYIHLIFKNPIFIQEGIV